jgi:hypothetical protein
MAVEANLTAEELVLFERLKPLYEQELLRMVKAMASKKEEEMFGQNEYEIRDRVHELGAKALEIAVNERQKKGRRRGS